MKRLLFIFLIAINSIVFARGYHIKVTISSITNKSIKLAYYYSGQIYVRDTLILDNNGSGVFKADTLLPQGLYKIYLDDKNHFDFLLGKEQVVSLSNEAFDLRSLKVVGATETVEFAKYHIYLVDLQEKNKKLNELYQNSTGEEKSNALNELNKLNDGIVKYWKDTEAKYPGTFLAKFLISNYIPALDTKKLPENIQKNDSLLNIARFYHQQAHFWDNFDYTDERFLYTPLLKPKLETWFTQMMVQQYDSIKKPVIDFIEKTKSNRKLFQYYLSHFTNATLTSTVMGMDALFVDLARKYYLSGQVDWLKKEVMDKIRENVIFAENNLLGMQAPALQMEDINGKPLNLYAIQSKITILLIYEPDCSHCKEFVPKFHTEIYQKFRSKGLEVMAIYSMNKKEEWQKFINEHGLSDWNNVWDPNHLTRFKILLDGRTTPAVYILDRNKKIIAKKLGIEQIAKVMEFEFNMK
jgi:peroxiredoxin